MSTKKRPQAPANDDELMEGSALLPPPPRGHVEGHTFEFAGTQVRSDELLLFERVATDEIFPLSSDFVQRMRAIATAASPPPSS